jgi:DNA-binding MarR family transcriptional regulator
VGDGRSDALGARLRRPDPTFVSVFHDDTIAQHRRLKKPRGRELWQAVAAPMPPLTFDPIREAARQWRKHWGRSTAPPMAAVTSVMRAYQIMLARLNDQLEPHGLTFPRYEALMLLYYSRAGCLPLGKMGARLQLHQTSVTSLVDGLVALDLVERTAHPSDRRTTLAAITDRGREVAELATRDLNALRFGTKPLTRPDLDALFEMLERFRRDAGDFVK